MERFVPFRSIPFPVLVTARSIDKNVNQEILGVKFWVVRRYPKIFVHKNLKLETL